MFKYIQQIVILLSIVNLSYYELCAGQTTLQTPTSVDDENGKTIDGSDNSTENDKTDSNETPLPPVTPPSGDDESNGNVSSTLFDDEASFKDGLNGWNINGMWGRYNLTADSSYIDVKTPSSADSDGAVILTMDTKRPSLTKSFSGIKRGSFYISHYSSCREVNVNGSILVANKPAKELFTIQNFIVSRWIAQSFQIENSEGNPFTIDLKYNSNNSECIWAIDVIRVSEENTTVPDPPLPGPASTELPNGTTENATTPALPKNETTENSTTPVPLQNGTTEDSTTPFLPQNGTKENSTTPIPPQNGTTENSTTPFPSQNGTTENSTTPIPPQNGTTENSTTPFTSQNGTTENSTTPIPPQNGTTENSTTPFPSQNGTTENSTTVPPKNGTTENSTTPLPSQNGTTENLTTPVPPQNGTTENSTTPLPPQNGTTENLTTPVPPQNGTTENSTTSVKPPVQTSSSTKPEENSSSKSPSTSSSTEEATNPTPNYDGHRESTEEMGRIVSTMWIAIYLFLALFCVCFIVFILFAYRRWRRRRRENDPPNPNLSTSNPRASTYQLNKMRDNPAYETDAV